MGIMDKFEAQKDQRVLIVTIEPDDAKKSDLSAADADECRGIEILKNERDELVLCRKSPDGWAQAYVISDDNGPLKAGP